MYGISTDKAIGINTPYSHAEGKSYYGANGRIYQNGGARVGGPVVHDGSTVTIVADLLNWRIIWEVNGTKAA